MEAATAGTIALWGSIAALGVSLIVPRRHTVRPLWIGVTLAWVSVLVLLVALLGNDFTLDYVARTTSRATPWPYRISALWGGMEGSLLFYAALVLGIGAYGVRRHGRVEHSAVTVIGMGFLLLTALGANPFRRLDIPAVDGDGLLAILQHPAMIYHPPILYFGLTALVVPFALTVGWVWRAGGRADSVGAPLALEDSGGPPTGGGTNPDVGAPLALEDSGDPARGTENQSTKYKVQSTDTWVVETRRWLTWSWTWLIIGMAAGANWAYIELGWGGYWAWDPVENTALMPWLAATVFLHGSRVYQRDGRLLRWTVFFAMFPFALSVLGVYLTRSGVTGSIHAFAEDPVIGKVLLTAALVVTGVVVLLVLRVGKGLEWGRVGPGRGTWLAASAVLVTVALVFILVGSAYPAFLAVFWDRTVVVGSGFFVTTVLPVAVLMTLLVGHALNTTWTKSGLLRSNLLLGSLTAIAAGTLAVNFAIEVAWPGVVLLAVAASGIVLLGRDLVSRRHPRRYLPALVAHLGFLVMMLGAGGSALGTEFIGPMSVGETATVGPFQVELVEVNVGEEGRFVYAEGVFLLDGQTELRPQIRGYEQQRLPIAEPVLRSTPIVDVIVAVTRFEPGIDGFEVSVFVRPMVWWVWVGAVVVAVAGVLALKDAVSAGRRREARAGPRPAETTI